MDPRQKYIETILGVLGGALSAGLAEETPDGAPRLGYVLMIFDVDSPAAEASDKGFCALMSNGNRHVVAKLMRDAVARLQEQTEREH